MPVKWLVFFAALVPFNVVHALDLKMRPSLTLREVYSDNINLSPSGEEKGAFVTELSPGISVFGRSARTALNLNYRAQGLYNSYGNSGIRIANQLQLNSYNTLLPNRFFIDSRSSISQQNINNNRIAIDNISGQGNRANVMTFGISPYFTPHFGDFANGLFRINYDKITSDTYSTQTNSGNSLSDSNNIDEIINLRSGSDFKRINWNLLYNNRENFRDDGDDVKFQNADGIIRAYLFRNVSAFTRFGYSDSSYANTTGSIENGFFYTFGARWTPSRSFFVEAGAGNNSFVTIFISPIQRLSWTTSVRNNSVGLNSGLTWETALNYRTRRSVWSLFHDNTTTTVQDILIKQQVFNVVDSFGNPVFDPVTEQPLQTIVNLPSLNNEVIVSQNWRFSTSFFTGKSTFSANAFFQDREYQVSGEKEKVSGISGNWYWRFASRSSAYLGPMWQHSSGNNAGNDFDWYTFRVGVMRSITHKVNGNIEFNHTDQSSGVGQNNYQENRITASIFMVF